MKTIFDKSVKEELISRINSINETSTAKWGKMNGFQMLKHCTMWEEMIAEKTKYKRMLLGRIFGKMALKGMLKDETPLKQNVPTVPGFAIKENGDIELQKKKWIAMIEENTQYSNNDFVHPFFGKMTKEEIGYIDYKHTDHHLRQFGV